MVCKGLHIFPLSRDVLHTYARPIVYLDLRGCNEKSLVILAALHPQTSVWTPPRTMVLTLDFSPRLKFEALGM
jgi:hypothetical protein